MSSDCAHSTMQKLAQPVDCLKLCQQAVRAIKRDRRCQKSEQTVMSATEQRTAVQRQAQQTWRLQWRPRSTQEPSHMQVGEASMQIVTISACTHIIQCNIENSMQFISSPAPAGVVQARMPPATWLALS